MREWNAVISVHEHGFRKAIDLFGDFGEVKRTEFFNVLLLKAADIQGMLESLRDRLRRSPESLAFLARLVPVQDSFVFHSRDEFEARSREIVAKGARLLSGKNFHVRIRRRGFKGSITSPDEERLLDQAVLDALEKSGGRAEVTFEDPDAVIAIETVGTWAGVSIWTREEGEKYPFFRV